MKKNDFILFILIALISVSLLILFSVSNTKKDLKALVYVNHDLKYEVTLRSIEEEIIKEFNGNNGKVTIKFTREGVKVLEETSKYNICSRQAMINKSGESLICLPNDIYVKLVRAGSNEVVVG